MKVSVSVLSSSIKAVDIVKRLDQSECDYVHIDIMDGKFVENETDKELTVEEAIKVVQECWRDMPMDYYSWDLEKIIFKGVEE